MFYTRCYVALIIIERKMNLGSCDLIVELRISGESKERIKVTSDEGDGFMFHQYPEFGEITDDVKEGWKNQLMFIIDNL